MTCHTKAGLHFKVALLWALIGLASVASAQRGDAGLPLRRKRRFRQASTLPQPYLPAAYLRTPMVTSGGRKVEIVLAAWPSKRNISLDPSDFGLNGAASLQSWWTAFPGGAPFNAAQVSAGAKTVTFTANPFRATAVPTTAPFGTLDNVKHLSFSPVPFPIRPGRVLTYSVNLAVQVSQGSLPARYKQLVSEPEDDPRLASCGASLMDTSKMLMADFLLTDKTVWALYGRLPFARTADYKYHAFTYMKRVAGRKDPNDAVDLELRYDPKTSTLSWAVDGEVRLEVSKLGFPPDDPKAVPVLDLGGEPEVITPASFSTGLGCFTMLDAADPNDSSGEPAVGLLKLNAGGYKLPSDWAIDPFDDNAPAAKDNEALRLFGQGTKLSVLKYLVVQR